MAALLVMSPALPASPEPPEEPDYPEERLKIGDAVPHLHFEDVYGTRFCSHDFEDWVIVYSFADRVSHKEFRSVIGPAGLEVEKAHPELKIVYVGVADLIVVPTLFSEFVLPILRMLMNKSNQDLEEAHRIWRVPLRMEKARFYMVPDFTGHYLYTFGLKNAKKYQAFVVYKDKIHAAFDPSHPPYVDYYLPVFDRLSEQIYPPKEAPSSQDTPGR